MVAKLILWLTLIVGALAVCPGDRSITAKFSTKSLAAGADVNIPAGEVWAFDMAHSPMLGVIRVYGELLFLDDIDVMLHAKQILVENGGKFTIGDCDCPFTHKAVIELLTGAPNDPDLGTKTIGVRSGGTLHFYGQVRGPTWTRLASTATAGATSITLIEPVQWAVGDTIVIAPSDFPTWQNLNDVYSWKHNAEERVITAVNGNTVSFATPLTVTHYAKVYESVEMRAPVALLTRNIVVTGDAGSDTTKIGGHMMFLGGSHIKLQGVEVTKCGQYKNLGRYPVHFHRGGDASGQSVTDCAIHNNYQRSLTIHDTHNLTIERNVAYKTRGHMFFLEDGTEHGNTFSWNLGMIVYGIPAAEQLPGISSDDNPVIWWITNPDNTWVNNVGIGSPNHCWWFALPINPMGPSFTRDVIPRWTPLRKFANNHAGVCGEDGMHIDQGPNQAGVPGGSDTEAIRKYNSCCNAQGQPVAVWVGTGYDPKQYPDRAHIETYSLWTNNKPVTANFEGFTAYKCRNRAVWLRGDRITFSHARFCDCAIGITFAIGGLGTLQDSIIVGESDNYGDVSSYEMSNGLYGIIPELPGKYRSIPKNWPPAADIPAGVENGPFYPIRGYEFYDGPNEINNVRLVNFKSNSRRRASGISMLREDEFGISQSNRAYKVFYQNSDPILFPDFAHDGDKSSVVLDRDGTATGHTPVSDDQHAAFVNRLHGYGITQSCMTHTSWEVAVCPNHFAGLRAGFDSGITLPAGFNAATAPGLLKITRPDAVDKPYYICGGQCNAGKLDGTKGTLTPTNGLFGTVLLHRDNYIHFIANPPATFSASIGNHRHSFNGDGLAPYNEVRFAICYPPGTVVNTVMWNWKSPTKPASSLQTMRDAVYTDDWSTKGDNMWYHDTASGYVWVRMIIQKSQATTPSGFGDGCWISVSVTLGSGTANCAIPTVATIPDKRPTPPHVGFALTPFTWNAPPPAEVPRGTPAVCATLCGNGKIDAGEQCDGGAGCTKCVCGTGFAAAVPVAVDCVASCGNGKIDAGEECDGGAGCSACKCGTGFEPASPATAACKPLCGNGKIDAGEQCDGGAGCSATCTCNAGFVAASPVALACLPLCGNGKVDAGEQCDGGAGCSSTTCTCTTGFTAAVPAAINCIPNCGNGKLDAGEDCDKGLGCSGSCKCNSGYQPTSPLSTDCTLLCGNGKLDAGEQCDGGAGCEACACKAGFQPTSPLSTACTSKCGNGVLDAGEQCEVGGTGCTATCACDVGYEVTSPLSKSCQKRCGNGIIDAGELCEIGGVGCTATCTCDAGYEAKSPAAKDCQNRCGNGIVDVGEQCDGGVGCFACSCKAGFEALSPATKDCRPLCGNSKVDAGETCDGGAGCNATCTCDSGFEATSPLTTDCQAVCGNGKIDGAEQCDSGAGCTKCACGTNFEPKVPVAVDCAPKCGNKKLDVGETCDGGAGCTAQCACQAGFEVTSPVSTGCKEILTCGNGVVDAGEQCESGGVGCNLCTCSAGFAPNVPATKDCKATCGNGAVDAGEKCDGGAGCDKCACQTGFEPTDPVSASCQPLCGNKRLDAGEECDGQTGCSATCTCSADYKPTEPRSLGCTSLCGNGVLDLNEQCDGGAGCAACTCESGYQPASPLTTSCISKCGNEVIDAGEQCDGTANCLNCLCKEGYEPTSPASIECRLKCGNGKIDAGEACDGGAGCSATCACNNGYEATSPMSAGCQPLCGNGKLDAGEVCDKVGNHCSELCQCLTGYEPTVPASVNCHAVCGNQMIDAGEQCDSGTGCQECKCAPGFFPTEPASTNCFAATCGNKVIDAGEQCDGGIGCTACSCDTGYESSAPVSADCKKKCGNGKLDLGEGCDGGIACTNCACDNGYRSSGGLDCEKIPPPPTPTPAPSPQPTPAPQPSPTPQPGKPPRRIVWTLKLAVDCSDDTAVAQLQSKATNFVGDQVKEAGWVVSFQVEIVCTPASEGVKRQTESTVDFVVTIDGVDSDPAADSLVPMTVDDATIDAPASENDGLSPGVIAGIVVGIIAAVVVVALMAYFGVHKPASSGGAPFERV